MTVNKYSMYYVKCLCSQSFLLGILVPMRTAGCCVILMLSSQFPYLHFILSLILTLFLNYEVFEKWTNEMKSTLS